MSKADAKKHMAALYANEKKDVDMTQDHELPRDNLYRGIQPFEFTRSTEDDKTGDGHLVGHFAVFNRWTKIDSWFEGTFMERISPGAFKKTIKENRDSLRVLFQHGRDPQIGDKPLGVIEELGEDDVGVPYDVRMFDTSYNRDLIPGLEAKQYGASFRMRVTREDLNKEAKPSDYNPEGIPERTIKEIRLYEFGPVTFPAYEDATAGVRSLTDEILENMIRSHPERVEQFLLGGNFADRIAERVIKLLERSRSIKSVPTVTTTGALPNVIIEPTSAPPAPDADHLDVITSGNGRRSDYPRLVIKPNPHKDHQEDD